MGNLDLLFKEVVQGCTIKADGCGEDEGSKTN